MPIFDDNIRKQLKDLLGDIPQKEYILLFTSGENCRSCKDTQQYMTEFADLHENIELEVYDFNEDKEMVEKYDIKRVPTIVILDKDHNDHGIRFNGIPAGYEIHSLMAAVKGAAGVPGNITEEQIDRISKINKDIHIQVFVTPTCPHCPTAVIYAHKIAERSPNVKSEMIEATTFPELSQKYGVRGVPKIIINETHEFVGAQPLDKFLETIESV